MVAGKVKAAMGFQRTPSSPKPETPKHFPSPSSEKPPPPPYKTIFSRSFGVYFPRSSQVQPRPPDVTELLRLVHELQEKESRLKTEILQHKLLKETAAVVPLLESEISFKNSELQRSIRIMQRLEAENEMLRRKVESLEEMNGRDGMDSEMKMKELLNEIADLRREIGRKESEAKDMEDEIVVLRREVDRKGSESKQLEVEIAELRKEIERRALDSNEMKSETMELRRQMERKGLELKEMEKEIAELRRRGPESKGISGETGENRSKGATDASIRQHLVKNMKREVKTSCIESNQENVKLVNTDPKGEDAETEEMQQSSSAVFPSVKPRAPRIPKPPPKPSLCSSSSFSASSSSSSSSSNSRDTPELAKRRATLETQNKAGLKPTPPSLPAVAGASAHVPPPPPPPPARVLRSGTAKVRRVPEVVELYHSLMRRDSKRESSAGVSEVPVAANTRNMIGEIENRSAHLIAIKSDVETQGDFIRFLIKEVHDAAFSDIEDVVAFVKWLDDELSFLVDERAVLKHFDWPEHKADALRDAAFGYCDLKKLESEASSFCDDTRQPCSPALKKMQALLEKLEHGVYNLSRMREAAIKRYKGFQIPWEWMLETGYVSQIKLASVKLAMKYMKRISAELETVAGPDEEELMLQGVRFAFRVHQFAGGFDVETMRAFQELREKDRSCHIQSQNQQQQKLICRSTSC